MHVCLPPRGAWRASALDGAERRAGHLRSAADRARPLPAIVGRSFKLNAWPAGWLRLRIDGPASCVQLPLEGARAQAPNRARAASSRSHRPDRGEAVESSLRAMLWYRQQTVGPADWEWGVAEVVAPRKGFGAGVVLAPGTA